LGQSLARHLVAIHGVPRSGTSWIGEVVNSSPHVCYKYQPLFSYCHKHYLGDCSTREDIESFFTRIESHSDDFTDQVHRRRDGEFPHFQKGHVTHVAYKEVRFHGLLFNMMRRHDRLKLVAVIRCPIAVVASWYRAPREFRGDLGWKIDEEWRYAVKKNLNRPEEFNGFERWKDAAMIFMALLQQFPDRVHIINYAMFKRDVQQSAHTLMRFLGLNNDPQTARFVDESTSGSGIEKPYSVYRGIRSGASPASVVGARIVGEIKSDLEGSILKQYIDPDSD